MLCRRLPNIAFVFLCGLAILAYSRARATLIVHTFAALSQLSDFHCSQDPRASIRFSFSYFPFQAFFSGRVRGIFPFLRAIFSYEVDTYSSPDVSIFMAGVLGFSIALPRSVQSIPVRPNN